MCLGLSLNSPYILLSILKLYPRWKSKEKLFSHFFKGMAIETFDALCESFSAHLSNIVYNDAITEINRHLEKKSKVIIISASIENWIKPFMKQHGVTEVIGTKIHVNKSGKITGRFLTPNCNGQEKVNRFLQKYPLRKDYTLIAYGNSAGDKYLLKFADKAYFRLFNK